jgi:long-chain acyl-CoA synthetase
VPDLTHWASERPDALALVADDETRTFAELDANANRLARALRARGLVAGDAVALIAGNRPAFVETVSACQRAGFRLTTVNWHLTGDEAAYIVNDCEARALIATHDVAGVAAPTFEAAPDCEVALMADGAVDGF